jgi:hypothetical protein
VVEDSTLVGIVTTNDIFYKVVNPTLGIGEPGSRVVIIGGGTGENAEKVICAINRLGIGIKVIWAVRSSINQKNNLVIHLDTDDPRIAVGELTQLGYDAKAVNR